MARIIAIDPGTRLCGWAFFDDGVPLSAGVVKAAGVGRGATLAARACSMADQITDHMYGEVDFVVVERPLIYPDTKERDSDMMDLAVAAGVVGGWVAEAAGLGAQLVMPTPREWKGTIPKPIHNERTKAKCPAAVALVESTVPKSQQNHVWDAVGLALWQIGKG